MLTLLFLLMLSAAVCTAAGAAPDPAHVNLAPLAELSCRPAADGDSLRAVVDGNPASALVFAVHSEGEGSVTLTWNAPRQIDRVRVLQGHNAYYSTAFRITADRDGDGAFEAVLWLADPAPPYSRWAARSFEPVALRALRLESFAGVSKGKRAHPLILEVEAYGLVTPDDLRKLMRMGIRPDAFPALKPMCLETPLVSDGQAVCTILVPAEDGYGEIGGQLAQAIATTLGARPRVTTVPAAADPARETVIAVGQMLNNEIIERLYWNRYLYVESLCPGRDGFVVRTVHNPYPWTAGHNIVVLGSSTQSGARRAAAELATMLQAAQPTGSLGYLHRVQLPAPGERETDYVVEGKNYTVVKLPERDLTQKEAQALVTAEPKSNLLAFQELAQKYLVTGEQPYLQAARRVLMVLVALYEKDPDRHPTWPEETNARFIIAAWDAVEEAPVFSDQDRLRITNMLLRFLYSLVARTSDYGNLENNDTIIWNHTTFPLLGLYWGGRYFRRYYDCTFMDTFLRKAEGAFRGQETCWKPQCDADSYLVLTMGHTIEYALAENRMSFFESGNIRAYADYLIGICDNRGWAAGFGDSGRVRTTAIPDGGLPYAFWYTKDQRYLGYLNAVHNGHWVNPFHQDVIAQLPDDCVGLRVYSLHRQVYEYTARRAYYGEPSGPPNIPFEQAFDKIAFREKLGPDGQYFLLDGYSRGKHLHYDANAILKLTHKGEDWLIDGDYLVRNTTEHNMVSVIRNGRAEKLVPECAGLLHHADLPRFGLTETWIKDYNGVDWRRSIFWQKGGWIVLLDRMTALRPGDYRFDCVFKCAKAGREELRAPDRFCISRGGLYRFGNYGLETRRFHIVNADGADLSVAKRTGSAGPVKYLFERRAADMEPAQTAALCNLLYLEDIGETKDWTAAQVTDAAVLALTDQAVLVGAGAFEAAGLKVDAALFCISAEYIILVDAVGLRTETSRLTASAPVSAEIDLKQNHATLLAAAPAEVRLPGVDRPVPVSEGRQIVAIADNGQLQRELTAVLERMVQDTVEHSTKAAAKTTAADRDGLHELWNIGDTSVVELPEIRDAAVAIFAQNGPPHLLVCRGTELVCLTGGGTPVWTFQAERRLRCVTVADVDGDGAPEILCGGDDQHIRILDQAGHEMATHRMTERLVVGQGGTVLPHVNCLAADDLDGDGRREVLAADHYGSVAVISADGTPCARAYSELGDVAFDVGDIDGDGRLELVNGSTTGALSAYAYPSKRLFTFNNYGYAVRDV